MRLPSAWLETRLRLLYLKLGAVIGKKPLPFVLVPLFAALLAAVGLLRFSEEDRVWFLYSRQRAPSHYEHAVAQEYFQETGGKFWLEAPVTAKDGGSLLRPNYLEEVESLSEHITRNLTIPCGDGKSCSFRDLCVGPCNDGRVLSIFTLLYRNVTHYRNHPNFRLTYPTMHLYNDEYYVGEHFSGVKMDPLTNRISSMALVMLNFRTDKVNETIGGYLHQWELKLFDFVQKFEHPYINISASSDGLISHEVRRNGITCMPYFSLSVLAVSIFAVCTSLKHGDEYRKPFEALAGILGPLGAISVTFGILFLAGVPFSSIAIVMPFLVLGIGVDDFFILLHAFRETDPKWDVPKKMANALSQAGPSITITSLTNILSFAVGTFSTTPAIRLFCIYTSVGITIDFIFQVTFFTGCLALCATPSVQNVAKFKTPALRSSKIEPVDVTQSGRRSFGSRVADWYSYLAHTWPYRTLVLLFLAAYWSLALFGCSTIRIQIDSSDLILDDSPLHNVAWTYEEYVWKQGNLIHVFVNNPPDFSNRTSAYGFLDMVRDFENQPYAMGRNSTALWLRSYMKHLIFYRAEDKFYERLPKWLNDKSEGIRWKEFVRLRNSTIEKFFFTTGFAMGDDLSWTTRTKLQNIWRSLSDKYSQFNVTVFQTWSFYVDQFETIGSTTLTTVIVALIAMALVCLTLIPNPMSVIATTCAMFSTNAGVFGILSLWDVNLDPITMCTILTSIGFSVDFTVHLSYHYYRFDSQTKDISSQERLAEALGCIGWPMIQAGISTLLGLAPLALVPSYMVTVFIKTVILVVILGLVHGLIILPVMLTALPSSWHCAKCLTQPEKVKQNQAPKSDPQPECNQNTV